MTTTRTDRALSYLLVVAALLSSVAAVYRFLDPNGPPTVGNNGKAVRVEDWKSVMDASLPMMGDNGAPITIVVFTDLECPACRGFHQVLEESAEKHPGTFVVRYAPLPLPSHRFAFPAARATECVGKTGSVGSWVRVLYEKQDSLGLKSWSSFAAEAGVADTLAIEACARATDPIARIDSGVMLAKALKLRGTPSIVVNGMLLAAVPDRLVMDSLAAAIQK